MGIFFPQSLGLKGRDTKSCMWMRPCRRGRRLVNLPGILRRRLCFHSQGSAEASSGSECGAGANVTSIAAGQALFLDPATWEHWIA